MLDETGFPGKEKGNDNNALRSTVQAKFEGILHEATPEKGLRVRKDRPIHLLLAARTVLSRGSE